MSDIVERARQWVCRDPYPQELAIRKSDTLISEMADRIEQLEQHKRAQAEDIMTLGQQMGQIEAQLTEDAADHNRCMEILGKRIEQLEAALKAVCDVFNHSPSHVAYAAAEMGKIARAALEHAKDPTVDERNAE